MASVVVFGKPRAFESVEFIFDDEVRTIANKHDEPILKPQQFDSAILHYFARDNYVGVEYYTRANGNTSGRDGIVFGVCIKSQTDINIFECLSNIIQPFWRDFATDLLDDSNTFTDQSVIERLQNTTWTDEEIDKVKGVSLQTQIVRPKKEILLLVVSCLNDICLVENSVKEYKDVFISDTSTVFTENLNSYVYEKAGKRIFEFKDNNIVPCNDESTPEEQQVPQNSLFRRIAKLPIWGGGENNSDFSSREYENGGNDKGPGLGGKNIRSIILGIVAILFIVVICLYAPKVIEFVYSHEGEQPIDSVKVADDENVESDNVVELEKVILKKYTDPINERINLEPQIYPTSCTKYYPGNFIYRVSDSTLAHIYTKNNGDICLGIDKRLSNDTKITVKVFLDTTCYGEQTYTIAKAQNGTSKSLNNFIVPQKDGKDRTLEEYLKDLRTALDSGNMKKDDVISECQKIIKSDNFKDDLDAANLMEYATNSAVSDI